MYCIDFQFPNDIWYWASVHLFVCHLHVFMVRCLFRAFAHLLFGLFIFLLLSFKSSLCILDNGPLSDMSFANVFFHLWLVPLFCFHCMNSQHEHFVNKEIQKGDWFAKGHTTQFMAEVRLETHFCGSGLVFNRSFQAKFYF